MSLNIEEVFYTLTEAAKHLGVERHTLSRWIKAKKIVAQRAGGVVFIERSVVEQLRRRS